MDTKDVIFGLRVKRKLSQEELAEKIYVTRQEYGTAMSKNFSA